MLTEYDDEQGVCVPYPDDDVKDATDQRLPAMSALLEQKTLYLEIIYTVEPPLTDTSCKQTLSHSPSHIKTLGQF